MVFAIKCIIACVLFTIALEILAARRRDVFVNDYPPVVTDRLRDLHMVADILMAPFDKFYKITCMTLTQQPQKTFLRLYPCPGRTRKTQCRFKKHTDPCNHSADRNINNEMHDMCLLIIPKHMQSHIPRTAAPRNIKTAMISMIQPITWAPFFPLCLQELVLILLPIFHFPLLFILICRLLKRPAKSRQRRKRSKLRSPVHP